MLDTRSPSEKPWAQRLNWCPPTLDTRFGRLLSDNGKSAVVGPGRREPRLAACEFADQVATFTLAADSICQPCVCSDTYKPGKVQKRKETWSEANPEGRWRCYDYDELIKRDKLSLDLFWIRDKSLTDTDSLPAPDIIAQEIADDLESALEQFTKIAARLAKKSVPTEEEVESSSVS